MLLPSIKESVMLNEELQTLVNAVKACERRVANGNMQIAARPDHLRHGYSYELILRNLRQAEAELKTAREKLAAAGAV
jgi:hypothetical protein